MERTSLRRDTRGLIKLLCDGSFFSDIHISPKVKLCEYQKLCPDSLIEKDKYFVYSLMQICIHAHV
jgi:hypothetical protein